MSNSGSDGPCWDIQAARSLYSIDRWGASYFDINEEGHVVARPLQEVGATVDLTDVIEEAKGRGSEVSFADSVSGHPAASRRIDQPGLSQFDRRV